MVKRGLITPDDAASVGREKADAARVVMPGQTKLTRLAISGCAQVQFAALDAEQDGGPDPAATAHFLMRRVYVTMKAEFGPEWRAQLTYNFSAQLFDVAMVEWGHPEEFTVDAGYRMVNFGREQRGSSGVLKAIERSGVTRWFTESNNGTRLGAGSYRVGVFADGKAGDFLWGAAITNPEQPTTNAMASGFGGAGNNTPALWLNGGHVRKGAGSTLATGVALGVLPDQGGRIVGKGDDLVVGNASAEYTAGRFNLLAEAFAADNAGGAVDGSNSRAWGAYAQPAWAFTPRFTGVARISYLDTDGRGATLCDVVPGTPLTRANGRVWDAYLGGVWYFRGDDLKISAGFVTARGEGTPAGGEDDSEAMGVRSQLQMRF
ncbi:MAG: hypothetical protein H7067_19885 [Burkholderiales bacterium]|nr:hypothetical protein [Opitutaceae bacterium]